MTSWLEEIAALDLVEERTFAGVELARGADPFAGKELYRCRFESAKLGEAAFARARFEACAFVDCDLSGWRPASTGLHGVRFEGCKLTGADLSRLAENPEVSFARCNLRLVVMNDVNLRATTFSECELREAQLVSCSFVDADFVRCDLARASFERCDLDGADFSTSTGLYLDPRQSRVKGAFVPVETAVQLAQAAGLLVDGWDEPPKRARKKRRG